MTGSDRRHYAVLQGLKKRYKIGPGDREQVAGFEAF